jgi:hypothetical protein
MKTGKIFILIVGLLGLLAASDTQGSSDHTLEFIPTQNALPGVSGTMTIDVKNGGSETDVHFSLRGGYPNTVYTIWVVYNLLNWPLPTSGTSVPSTSASTRPGFPAEGNGVAPLARLDTPFADGMGLDPGVTFVTNDKGDADIQAVVYYDLIRESPVGNKDIIVQCAPGPPASDGSCPAPSKKVNITTTWLREFIGQYKKSQRASKCANYDPAFDPDVTPLNQIKPAGIDARYWQCIDPATVKDPDDPWTGLPRVPRFTFDHFRLAPHPDDLTHGLIGGTAVDHFIDMVGRRCNLVPPVGPACPATFP